MVDDADALLARARELEARIEQTERDGDTGLVEGLRAERDQVRRLAAVTGVDADAAFDELLQLRRQLRKIIKADKRTKRWWVFRANSSADRWPSGTLPRSNLMFEEDERTRIVRRIYELEEALVGSGQMGDFPRLAPDNAEKWW